MPKPDYRVIQTLREGREPEFTISDMTAEGEVRSHVGEPAYPIGSSHSDLRQDLERMLEALTRPSITVDQREAVPVAVETA